MRRKKCEEDIKSKDVRIVGIGVVHRIIYMWEHALLN